jgi:putative addiction module component (TIGR02574 family)
MTRADLLQLPPQERLALIAELWDSLRESSLALTSEQESEIESRLSSLDEDQPQALDWPELRAELLQRLR